MHAVIEALRRRAALSAALSWHPSHVPRHVVSKRPRWSARGSLGGRRQRAAVKLGGCYLGGRHTH
eukprot:scaffold24451_cov62-Phaeocystis_antarctica.AAC.2